MARGPFTMRLLGASLQGGKKDHSVCSYQCRAKQIMVFKMSEKRLLLRYPPNVQERLCCLYVCLRMYKCMCVNVCPSFTLTTLHTLLCLVSSLTWLLAAGSESHLPGGLMYTSLGACRKSEEQKAGTPCL